jgi:hypothetical protein
MLTGSAWIALRIPAKSAGESGRSRPPILIEAGHPGSVLSGRRFHQVI